MGHELDLFGAQRGHVKGLGEPLTAFDLNDEHALARGREGQGEGTGDGGLADAALAGHDVQPRGAQVRAGGVAGTGFGGGLRGG